ncbi:hypothetical protein [Nonomuraea sp. NPDC050643]|uniref:hypothetical protein n=1 Tax=Nonomuraea sp. NPDC050643 TaxID=3155660 RepID=UPI0033FF13C0
MDLDVEANAPPAAPGGSRRHPRAVDIGKADTEVTRRLCCAAQSDLMFAQRLFDHVIRQPRLGVSVSPGVDLPAVLKHACAGRRRRAVRDCLLTAAELLALAAVLVSIMLAVLTLSFDPLRLVPWALGLLLVGTTLVKSLSELAYNRVITRTLHPDRFDPRAAPAPVKRLLRARIDEIAALARGNVSIYSGFKPFSGYGKVIGGWSFAIDVDKPRHEGGTTLPFEVHDIRSHVTAQVEALEWIGLEVEDRVFVSGRDVHGDHDFVDAAGRPRAEVDGARFDRLLGERDGRARPYTVIRLVGWDGELALTIFLRFVIVKRNLFIEASHSILTPLQEKFDVYDKIRPISSPWDFVRLAARGVGMFGDVMSAFSHRAEHACDRRALGEAPVMPYRRNFDHGASYSVREAASDKRYHRYFQKLDSEMYTKVVEQRIFDALVQFLDGHEVDTGELIKRQTTILNHGVLVTGGGSIQAQSVAAGSGAQASSFQYAPGGDGRR